MGQRAGVRAVLAALALLVGAGACEVDPNAPGRRGGGVGGGGRRTDVSGTWVYNVSNLSAAGVVCSAANFALSLQQQDSTFTGTYAGGEMVCVAPGEPPLELQGLTTTVTTPEIYALGTLTTGVSVLVIGLSFAAIALWRRLRRA